MEPLVDEPVAGHPQDSLLLGRSSWNANDTSLKYGWPDKNGRRARGGEIPISALPQAVAFAARQRYLTPEQIASIIKELTDVLADAASASN